jgi:hypothetical protein
MACHSADRLTGYTGYTGREYALALERDPHHVKDRHAQAYEVLTEERSRKIVRRLYPDKIDPRPEADRLCLSCHVQPNYDGPSRSAHGVKQFRLEDGVSCEACHGPAQHWLAAHFRDGWKDMPSEAKLTLGQRDTRSLLGRIRICVDCHVGRPGMEVNHDLIAAGHPRLSFEFSGFHFLLHKHWDEAKDIQAYTHGREEFETWAWLLGQLVSACTALELLADRAAGGDNRIWPEFAEHDCSACHHDLKATSERQERGFGKRKPGAMPQNRWYVAMLPQALDALGAPADKHLLALLGEIRAGLETVPPNRKQVAENALHAAAILGKLEVDKRVDPQVAANRFTTTLTTVRNENCGDDDAVQFFLASTALGRARRELQPALVRPTMRLLLQLPDDGGPASIAPVGYRSTLDALKKARSR